MALSGFQFGRIEGFALKPSARAKQGKRSATDIIAELYREEGAAPHVPAPQPPVILEGPTSAAAMQRLFLDELAARKKALRSARGRDRSGPRIRDDQQALEGGVYSLPVLTADYLAAGREDATDAQKLARANADRAIELHREWIHADAERRGLEVKVVALHLDEKFVHLHAHSFPKNRRMSVKECSPGHIAQEAFKAAWTAENGPKLTKDAQARMSRAYKHAMRDWQDEYWRECGSKCGLTRLGPGRQRLTRQEWLTSQAQAANIAAVAQGLQNRQKELSERQDEVKRAEHTLKGERIALAGKETALEAEMRRAKVGQQVAAAAIQTQAKIDDQEIIADQTLGLVLAPHATTEANETWWAAAQKRLRPVTKVWERLVKQAQRLTALLEERAALKRQQEELSNRQAELDKLIGDAGRDLSNATALRIAKQRQQQGRQR